MGSNSKVIEKAFLITLFQLVIILIAYTYLGMNYRFEQKIQPELRCMKISDLQKVCVSVFERNHSLIPSNKLVQVKAYHNDFKMLTFEKNSKELKNMFHNSFQQYFQLVNYHQPIKSIGQLTIDLEVKQIFQLLNRQNGKFIQKTYKKIALSSNAQVVVFYFLLPENGPIKLEPQLRITFPNRNSIQLNNKLCIMEAFSSVFIIFIYALWKYSCSQDNNNNKQNEIESGKLNRIAQFLLNFGANNIIYLLTIHNFWKTYNLTIINETLKFQTVLVPFIETNAYQSYVIMFPEWLLLAYLIYSIFQRYCRWPNVILIILSGILGALLFVIPPIWPQVTFQVFVISCAFIFGSDTKNMSNNQLTLSLVLTSFSIILMIVIKILWIIYCDTSNDFAARFAYNQIFILGSLICIFFRDQQFQNNQKRIYIPYDQYGIQQEQDKLGH